MEWVDGSVSMKSNRCPSSRSELQRDNSMILTINSQAGCDMTCAPRPWPYLRPVHHARFVSSCLNSRERKTEIRISWMALESRSKTSMWSIPSLQNHNPSQCSERHRTSGCWELNECRSVENISEMRESEMKCFMTHEVPDHLPRPTFNQF